MTWDDSITMVADLKAANLKLGAENATLRDGLRDLAEAIGKHHAAQGQDRCWQNDVELWQAAGLPIPDRIKHRCREYEAAEFVAEPRGERIMSSAAGRP